MENSIRAIVSTDDGVYEITEDDFMGTSEQPEKLKTDPMREVQGDAPDFRSELTAQLNKHSKENSSNTPDFILRDYLCDCLRAFDKASLAREEWYGIKLVPGGPSLLEES